MEHNIEEKECVKLLFQSLPDSYAHLIISIVNGSLNIIMVFNDVAIATLEEESMHKNKENRNIIISTNRDFNYF